MDYSVNLTAILISNLMGIIVLCSVIFGSSWRYAKKTRENIAFHVLVVTSIVSCIVDPLCFICNGKPGRLMYVVVYWGNAVMYIAELVIGAAWIVFMTSHIGVSLNKFSITVIKILSFIGAAAIIINRFYPIAYSVSADNLYSREGMFWYYLVIEAAFIFASIYLYFKSRKKSGYLRYFPVWAFVLPAVVGAVLQAAVYGISTINPFIALSISCATISIQNEQLFRDGLTGLYNRFFLGNVLERLKNRRRNGYSLVMMDINHFKSINDTLGHKEGDKALVIVSQVLDSCVNDKGLVIRYGGDEFILILYSCDEGGIASLVDNINTCLKAECLKSERPYSLSVSAGYHSLDGFFDSLDDVLDKTDKNMYDAKRKFYADNPSEDRRR